jgi:hypothetical protein
MSRPALLVNPASPSPGIDRSMMSEAARIFGLDVTVLDASDVEGLNRAFQTIMANRLDAMIVSTDALFNDERQRLIRFASEARVPTIYYDRAFVHDGGLLSYGASIADAYRQAGDYTARILKGARPQDLPVQQPTLFEPVVNVGTARVLKSPRLRWLLIHGVSLPRTKDQLRRRRSIAAYRRRLPDRYQPTALSASAIGLLAVVWNELQRSEFI